MWLCLYLLASSVLVSSEFARLRQKNILLYSSRRRRDVDSSSYDDFTNRIVGFDPSTELANLTIEASLQQSIVEPNALPDVATPNAIPLVFKGVVKNENDIDLGSAEMHFNLFDELQYIRVNDGHEDGSLIGERHLNRLEDFGDDDLIVYRQTVAKRHAKGTCAEPLGLEGSFLRTKDNPGRDKRDVDEEGLQRLRKLGNKSFKNRDCKIKLVADSKFNHFIGEDNPDKTIGYMISVITRADTIFRQTDWLDRRELKDPITGEILEARGFGFTIAKIEVWSDPNKEPYLNETEIMDDENIIEDCQTNNAEPVCRYLKEFAKKVKVEETLENGDKQKMCLAHLFTHTDFPDGILGLAHIGRQKNEAQKNDAMGICANTETDSSGAHLNTALTSTLNWAAKILTDEAELVTTHELGHNWGAYHDDAANKDYANIKDDGKAMNSDDNECMPTRGDGYYVMFRNAVTGEQMNNDKFSICSKVDISRQLGKCVNIGFTETKNQSCGNYKVEGGEECDSGFNTGDANSCCTSTCMFNKNITGVGKPAQCDVKNPLERNCCKECRFQPVGHICRADNQCMDESKCSGLSALCPNSVPKKDGTACTDKDKLPSTCRNIDGRGVCLDVCQRLGMDVCYCDNKDKLEMCHRCCKDRETNLCQPVHRWAVALNKTDISLKEPIIMKNNSVCYVGMCRQMFDENANKNVTRCIVNTGDGLSLGNLLEYFQPAKFKDLVKNNITGAIMIFSLMLWVPTSMFICYVDRKRREHNEKNRFQWPDYMSSFSYTYPNINPDILPQFSAQTNFHQSPNQSYALKVMAHLEEHINRGNIGIPSKEGLPSETDFLPGRLSDQNNMNKSSNNNKPIGKATSEESAEPLIDSNVSNRRKVIQKGIGAQMSWLESESKRAQNSSLQHQISKETSL